MYHFSKQSLANLETAHPDLQRLFNEVIKHRDCKILCGHRDEKLQNALFKSGNSNLKFPHSRHNSFPSKAVDALFHPFTNWKDFRQFHEFAGFVLGVASQMDIPIRWGGHFKTFYDAPHFELVEQLHR